MSTSCEFVRILNTYHEILPLRSNQNKDTHMHNQLQKLFVQSFILTLVYKVWIEKWVFDACRRQTVAFDWTVIYVLYLDTDLDLALYWYDECWLTSKASLNNLKNIKSKKYEYWITSNWSVNRKKNTLLSSIVKYSNLIEIKRSCQNVIHHYLYALNT